MYAGLRKPRKGYEGRRYSAYYLESEDETVLRLYVEATGHKPPEPRNAAMATQYEYGNRKCRTKAMRAAILSACTSERELAAA